MKISNQLKKARKDRKLTQEYVASQVNVSRKTISSWENGRGQPNSAYLKQLKSIYNTNLHLNYTQSKHKKNNKYFTAIYFINLILFILCLYNLYTGQLPKISILQLIYLSFFCIIFRINLLMDFKHSCKNIIIYTFLFIIFCIIIMNNMEIEYNFSTFLEDLPFFLGAIIHSIILTSSFFIITKYRNGK